MKKSELIKRRHEVNVEIQYNLINGCHQCPMFNRTESGDIEKCKDCPTFDILKRCGDELNNITKEYRENNRISSEGEYFDESEIVDYKKKNKREQLAEKITLEELQVMRTRASMQEIANHYGVKVGVLYSVYNHLSGKKKLKSKEKKETNVDRIDKLITFDEYIKIKKEQKKTIEQIAKDLGFGLKSMRTWVDKHKKERGIIGYL